MSELVLHLDDQLRTTLTHALNVAADLAVGARVDKLFPSRPWGDLRRFQRFVYDPIELRMPPPPDAPLPFELRLQPNEIPVLAKALKQLAESLSGGIPWVGLSEDERERLRTVNKRLVHEP